MNERPIPEAAQLDPNSVEMIRVWIAQRRLHCSLKIGMYRETTNIGEEKAWGIILADVVKHVAAAMEDKYSADRSETIRAVRDSFLHELAYPTSEAEGGFITKT